MFEEILARLAAVLCAVVRNQPGLDRSYIRRWLEEFDAAADEPVFLARFQELLDAE